MMDRTFSIVIPAYNGERFLEEAITCALGQSRPADEVIIVDDASSDRTAAIVREFGDRVRYVHNPRPTGFADAWNRAAGLASGAFVAILHQDDLLHPDFLRHMERAVEQYPGVRHFYAACDYIDWYGKVTGRPPGPHSPDPVFYPGKEYARRYLDGMVANRHIHRCPGVMTSRSLLLHECPYRKEAGHIADDDFFLRVGAYTDVAGISQPLASFRHHEGSETEKLESLTLRLARDYLFQTEYYKDGSPLLDKDDIGKINRQAVKFINILLFQSLRDGKAQWRGEAFRLRRKLDSLLPGFMKKALPEWGRLLWKMASPRGSDFIARKYVDCLALTVKAHHFVRNRFQAMRLTDGR